MFDTKIAIVVREDLATWQKLNVTAFLTSGIVGASEGLLGERYEDAAGNTYNPLVVQPMIVLSADADTIRTIYRRAMERDARLSLLREMLIMAKTQGRRIARLSFLQDKPLARRMGAVKCVLAAPSRASAYRSRPLHSCLSAKPSVIGHAKYVRQPWHVHGRVDKTVAGRQAGHPISAEHGYPAEPPSVPAQVISVGPHALALAAWGRSLHEDMNGHYVNRPVRAWGSRRPSRRCGALAVSRSERVDSIQ